jgi:protein-disulfide isomerase
MPTRVRQVLEITTSVIVLTTAIVVLWNNVSPRVRQWAREAPLPTDPIPLDGAAVKGALSAKVALIEFSDFECPFCGTFARETLPELERTFVSTGKVTLAFLHLPLPRHKFARPAAEIAECARQEDKFWLVHDQIFLRRAALDGLERVVDSLGLQSEAFQACRVQEAVARISADVALARRFGITGTPAFLIGEVLPDRRVIPRKLLRGAVPFRQLAAELERILLNTSRP